MIPFKIEATSDTNLSRWIAAKRPSVMKWCDEQGAVLFRGFEIADAGSFSAAVDVLCGCALDYIYRSTPRTSIGHGIYTATEYPAGMSIPLHNENAYQRDWPTVIMFCCLRPADNGAGQTPIADSVRVTERISKSVRETFKKKDVMYIRHYHENIDLPWQSVFQTNSKEEVNSYCSSNDIEATWLPDGTLRTRQICHSFAKHPVSQQEIWFNQAHLFHPSALPGKTRAALTEMFPDRNFPRNVTFGDGSEIDEDMLEEVRSIYEEEKVTFSWHKGDVLVLDNMRIAHGRTPYKGARTVLTAMGNPYSSVVSVSG